MVSKPLPRIVTVEPPLDGPDDGVTDVIFGWAKRLVATARERKETFRVMYGSYLTFTSRRKSARGCSTYDGNAPPRPEASTIKMCERSP